MLSRLLMVVGGNSAFSPPSPASFALTSAPNGGQNPWVNFSGIHHSGTTYFGWVDGSGNIEGAEYSGGVVSGPYTIHSNFEDDAHDAPAFVRRASDGKWIVVYSLHNGPTINLRVSTNADDFSAWGSATNLDSQLNGSRYTDYQLFERSGTFWMVCRNEPSPGTDSQWFISSCSSASPTSGWSSRLNIYRISTSRSYVITAYDAIQDRLHLIATNAASSGFTKLGHMYRDMTAGTWHKTDGTAIALTANFSSITEIYSGTGPCFGINMWFDASGDPVVNAWDGMDYVYLRLTGGVWDSTVITDTGTGYSYNNDGNFQPWGSALDYSDVDVVWLLKDDDGVNPQLWRYTTADLGATFTATQVTNNLSGDQTQVIGVMNAGSDLRAFWQSGSWTDYDNWNMGLTGVGG